MTGEPHDRTSNRMVMSVRVARYKYEETGNIYKHLREWGRINRWKTSSRLPRSRTGIGVESKPSTEACLDPSRTVYDAATSVSWGFVNSASAFLAAAALARRFVGPDPLPTSLPSTIRGWRSVRSPTALLVLHPYIYKSRSIRPRVSDQFLFPPSSRTELSLCSANL